MARQSLSSHLSLQPTPEFVKCVQDSLLSWYADARRDLPWRATRDPYAILVSEVMLQQTQVDRVLPKYAQFLAAFPTLADLAAAPTADVISLWVPLGYNRRAVSLQAIARQVLAEYEGKLPDTVEGLLKLKGIGRYTAGAIACFAYQQQVATVDTNIYRVLHRVFLGLEHPEPQLNVDAMFSFAAHVLPSGEAYNWNQALMDMGATICSSSNPQCARCPLQENCRAYQEMSQHSLFPSGTVLRQLRKVAEKKATYTAQPFTSSNRYFRGRVVAHLRTLPAGERLPLSELGPVLKPDFQAEDLPWLEKLLAGLQRDGLIAYTEDGVKLP
ncbi:MAG TPA: A/G-specific adenine glycosylase [Ktedonobacteraceae bacterium]|nr:A/G-specific adenine glycosylase [Ktedonobacteraceae bacterium]